MFLTLVQHTLQKQGKSHITLLNTSNSLIFQMGFQRLFQLKIQKPFDKDEEKAVVTTSFD